MVAASAVAAVAAVVGTATTTIVKYQNTICTDVYTERRKRIYIKKNGINLATFTPLMHLFKPKFGEIISSGGDFEIFVHTDTGNDTDFGKIANFYKLYQQNPCTRCMQIKEHCCLVSFFPLVLCMQINRTIFNLYVHRYLGG